MFRIVCFCDDKHLPKILWLLQGQVYDLTNEPVVNAKKVKGKVKANIKSGDKMEMLEQYLQDYKEVTPDEVRGFCKEVGLRPGGYSLVLSNAIKAGLLRRIGVEYRYTVLTKKKPKLKRSKKSKTNVVTLPKKNEAVA
jgi:hypothetical protein